MRYAHLSPAFLSAEVGLLDPPPPKAKSKRARKGQRSSKGYQRGAKVVKFPNVENGSLHWTISATGSSEKLRSHLSLLRARFAPQRRQLPLDNISIVS